MKIKVYDPSTHEYKGVAECAEFRLDMDNGDAYDMREVIDLLKIKPVNSKSHLDMVESKDKSMIYIGQVIDK